MNKKLITRKEIQELYPLVNSKRDWYVDEHSFEFVDKIIEKWFESKKEYFTNYGRDMENLFLSIKIVHSRRVFGKPVHERKIITSEDMDNGFKKFCENPEVKKRELLNSNKNIILSLYS